ncbi:MAG: peptide deformylase [Alphaproteobacteria bacterium]|nr:peptide deformylase [Alphaproteobacteria bacterium]
MTVNAMLEMKLCGDPVLREIAVPVNEITNEIKDAMRQMVGMMDTHHGVGLAAPQVGILSRFLVMKAGDEIIRMVNPKITEKSPEIAVLEEGCLSILGPDGIPIFADVARPESVVVEWMDERGRPHNRKFSNTCARIVQHEIDHLDGILFIDYLSSAKREMVMNKVRKRKAPVMAKRSEDG